MKKQLKVVGYIRCASKDNAEKSISVQKEAIKDFCKDNSIDKYNICMRNFNLIKFK